MNALNGVRVSFVIRGGAAHEAGLRQGDRILALGNRRVFTVGDISSILRRLDVGDYMRVTYERRGNIRVTYAQLESWRRTY